MDVVLDAFKNYLKSIDLYQSGKKQDFSVSLSELDDLLESGESDKEFTVDPDHESVSFSLLINSIKSVEFEEDVIPYTMITKLIYTETRYNRELYDTLEDNMKKDWERYNNKNEDVSSEATRIFLKIKEHIGLSIIQRNHINDRLNDQLNETLDKLDETKSELTSMSTELDEVAKESREKADSLVVQFISILGIFAAIIMGAFGSFQGFTSIFSNAENIPIGKTLIISAAGAAGVSLILFLLLHAISKLTSFPLSNCDCHNRRKTPITRLTESFQAVFGTKGGTAKCTCSLFNKYPTIFIINYLFYYVAVTGFVFMYFNFMDYFNMNVFIHIIIVSTFYFIATVSLIIIHKYLIDKDSDVSLTEKVTKDLNSLKKSKKGA